MAFEGVVERQQRGNEREVHENKGNSGNDAATQTLPQLNGELRRTRRDAMLL